MSRFYVILVAFAASTLPVHGFQFQVGGGGGAGGGGGGAPQGTFTVAITDGSLTTNYTKSRIDLQLTGTAPISEQSNNNPHSASIVKTNEWATSVGGTSHTLASGFDLSDFAYTSADASGGFGVASQNINAAAVYAKRKYLGNIASVILSNRPVVQNPQGVSVYPAQSTDATLILEMSGAPQDIMNLGFYSHSQTDVVMPRMYGVYSHNRPVNGTLTIAFTITIETENAPPDVITNDPMGGTPPLGVCTSTLNFAVRPATGPNNSGFILQPTIDIITSNDTLFVGSGYAAGGTSSRGKCAIGCHR